MRDHLTIRSESLRTVYVGANLSLVADEVEL